MIDDLSYGPLANLAIGSSGGGTIPFTQQNRIVHLINSCLSTLHSRFLLYQKELYIRYIDGRSLYPLTETHSDAYAATNPATAGESFIIDSPAAPFTDDFIQLLEAWGPPNSLDPDGDLIELGINDLEADRSVFLPAPDILQIPDGTAGEVYQFMYQADHYKLVPGLGSQIVNLPEYLFGALEAWVAYKVYSSMNGEEHRARAMELFQTYELVCREGVTLGFLKNTPTNTNTKLEERGFV